MSHHPTPRGGLSTAKQYGLSAVAVAFAIAFACMLFHNATPTGKGELTFTTAADRLAQLPPASPFAVAARTHAQSRLAAADSR